MGSHAQFKFLWPTRWPTEIEPCRSESLKRRRWRFPGYAWKARTLWAESVACICGSRAGRALGCCVMCICASVGAWALAALPALRWPPRVKRPALRWGSAMQAPIPSSRARMNARPPAWQPPSGWSSTRPPMPSSPNTKAPGAMPSTRSSGAIRSPPTHRRTSVGCLSPRLTSPTSCARCRPSVTKLGDKGSARALLARLLCTHSPCYSLCAARVGAVHLCLRVGHSSLMDGVS